MYWFTDDWAAARTGRHRTTIARWRRARAFPPELVRLAELELDGRLELIHAAWSGWRIDRAGALVSPAGERFAAGEILSIPLRLQQIRALERAARPKRTPWPAGSPRVA